MGEKKTTNKNKTKKKTRTKQLQTTTTKKIQNKGKNRNSNCPLTISKSFHRRTTNDRVSLTVCLFFLGNVFWILAKILCLYNTMLCGMAKCYQHSAPPTLGRMRRNPNKRKTLFPFPSPPQPPQKFVFVTTAMNPKMEMRRGDRGESLGGVGTGSGMLQAEIPREIRNSFNEKWERKAKSGFCPFGNGGMLL